MARLLYVIGDLDVGGAERHLLEVLPALKAFGHSVEVFTLTHRGTLAPSLIACGIMVHEPPFGTWARVLPRTLRRVLVLSLGVIWLWVRLKLSRPDVVHFFLPMSYIIGALVSLLTPVGIRVMSRRSLGVYQRGHPFLMRIEKWLHRKMEAVLGNSSAVIAELRDEGVIPGKLGLIYNGIETTSFEISANRNSIRRELDINENAVVMAMVANLIPYKGHADLIDALATVREELPDGWRLLCIGGDRGIGASLKTRAESAGVGANILWLNERNDVIDLLSTADIGVLCSHQEGFSNAILEGMAAGLPMVVTNVGGNAEAVQHGITGLVVPSHNPDNLGHAILELSSDGEKRSAYGSAGRVRLEKCFSFNACVDRYVRLYRGLLSGKSASVQAMIDGQEIA